MDPEVEDPEVVGAGVAVVDAAEAAEVVQTISTMIMMMIMGVTIDQLPPVK